MPSHVLFVCEKRMSVKQLITKLSLGPGEKQFQNHVISIKIINMFGVVMFYG